MDLEVWQNFPSELFVKYVVPRLMYAQQVALATHLFLIRAAYPCLLTLKDDTVWLLKIKCSGKIKVTRYHHKESDLRFVVDDPRLGVYQQPGKPDQRARFYYRCKGEKDRDMVRDLDSEDFNRDDDRDRYLETDRSFGWDWTDEDFKDVDMTGFESEGDTDKEEDEKKSSIWIDEGVAFPKDSFKMVEALHSAHGLVLFRVRTPPDSPFTSFAVVNPLTKRIKLLKPHGYNLPYSTYHSAKLEVNKVSHSYRIYVVHECDFMTYDSVSQSWEVKLLEDVMDPQVVWSRMLPLDKNIFTFVVKNYKVCDKYNPDKWNVGKLGLLRWDIPQFQICEKTLPIYFDKFRTYGFDSLDGKLILAGKSHKKKEKFCLYEVLPHRTKLSYISEGAGEDRLSNTRGILDDRLGNREDMLGDTGTMGDTGTLDGEYEIGKSVAESENKPDKFEVTLHKRFVLKSNREAEVVMKVNANAEGYYWVETTTRGMTLWKTPEGTYEVLFFRHDYSDRAHINYPFCPSLINP